VHGVRRSAVLSDQTCWCCSLDENIIYWSGSLDLVSHKMGSDILFNAAYDRAEGQMYGLCSIDRQEQRERKKGEVIQYGTIASGNQAMKNAAARHKVSAVISGVPCFEIKAVG
jgi:hypothetical protein